MPLATAVKKGLIKATPDDTGDEERIVLGYVSTDDLDKDDEIITLDALRGAVGSWPGNIRLMHEMIPIGRCIRKYVDDRGLFVEVQLGPGSSATEAWENVKAGILDAFSVWFRASRYNLKDVGENTIIEWTEITIVEASLVDNPANAGAVVTGYKGLSAQNTEDDEMTNEELKAALGDAIKPVQDSVKSLQESIQAQEESSKTLTESMQSLAESTKAIEVRVDELENAKAETDTDSNTEVPESDPNPQEELGIEDGMKANGTDDKKSPAPRKIIREAHSKGLGNAGMPAVLAVGEDHSVTPDAKFKALCPGTSQVIAGMIMKNFGERPGVRKAIDNVWDSSALSGGGAIPDDEMGDFVDLTRKEANMLPVIDYGVTNTPTWKSNLLEWEDRQLRAGGEWQTPSSGYQPPVTNVSGTTTPVTMQIIITWQMLQRNLKQGGLLTWANQTIAQKFGRDFQDLVINGDTSSGDPFLELLDGMIVDYVADGDVNDADLGTYADWLYKDHIADDGTKTAGVFGQMYQLVAAQDIPNPENMIWLMSKRDAFDYVAELTGPATPQSDKYFQQGMKAVASVLGMPVLAVDKWPSQYVALLHGNNVSARIWRELRIYSEFDGQREGTILTLHGDVGWMTPLHDRIVLGWNATP